MTSSLRPAGGMTVAEAWAAGREHLAALGVDEAGITAEVLLRHALGASRTALYLAWTRVLDPAAWDRFQTLLAARARGRPVAYITGRREFMGLDFTVDERVLIPRPETEVLVDVVLTVTRGIASPVIADIGTGSGAIAVSLAVFRPDATVVATDLSADALEVARLNAGRHGVEGRIRFLEGDLLEPLRVAGIRPHIIACNPPYVDPQAVSTLPREIREFEPAVAVIAPGDATSLHRRLVVDASDLLASGGWLVLEVAAGQASRVVELLDHTGSFGPPQVRRDGLGWERVVAAQTTSPVANGGHRVSYYQLTFQPAVQLEPRPITMFRVDPDDGASPRRAVEVLREGGLLVFPSDEGYLVGCSARHPEAIRRLCEVTGASPDALLRFAATPEQGDAAGGPVWPLRHPVTLALMRDAGVPLVGTPAHAGARPSPSAQQALFVLGDAVGLVLDAGPVRGPAAARR